MIHDDQLQNLNQALAKAALDRDYREQMIADPRAALMSEGVEIPDELSIELVEVSPSKMVVALPPANDEPLSEAELGEASGGLVAEAQSGLHAVGDNELFQFNLPPAQHQTVNHGFL